MPLSNVSLLKPNAGAPLDIQTQQQQLALEAAIAQAMIAQGMRDQSPVVHTGGGNPFARDIPNIAPIGDYFQRKQGEERMGDIGRRQGELANETQRITDRDIADALLARQGSQGTPAASPGDAGTAATPGNYNEYVQKLLRSTVPSVRAMGAEAIKHMLNPQDILKEGDKYAEGTASTAMTSGNMGALAPKPKLEAYEGSVRAIGERGQPMGPPTAVNTFDQPKVDETTGLPMQTSPVTGQSKAFTGGNISTTRAKDVAEATATIDELKKGMEGYRKDVNSLGNLVQAEYEISKTPETAFGIASWLRTQGRKLGELIGADKLGETPSIEKIRSSLGNLSLDKARILAPVSDNDWDKIREILGTEANTKRALEGITQIMIRATARNMGQHRDFVRAAAKDPQLAPNPDAFLQKWAPDFRIDPVQSGGGEPKAPIRYDEQGNRIG